MTSYCHRDLFYQHYISEVAQSDSDLFLARSVMLLPKLSDYSALHKIIQKYLNHYTNISVVGRNIPICSLLQLILVKVSVVRVTSSRGEIAQKKIHLM